MAILEDRVGSAKLGTLSNVSIGSTFTNALKNGISNSNQNNTNGFKNAETETFNADEYLNNRNTNTINTSFSNEVSEGNVTDLEDKDIEYKENKASDIVYTENGVISSEVKNDGSMDVYNSSGKTQATYNGSKIDDGEVKENPTSVFHYNAGVVTAYDNGDGTTTLYDDNNRVATVSTGDNNWAISNNTADVSGKLNKEEINNHLDKMGF